MLLHNARSCATRLSLALAIAFLSADPARAYLGPGSGLAGLGSLLALLGVVGFAVLGFVWYPLKRLVRRLRRSRSENDEGGKHK